MLRAARVAPAWVEVTWDDGATSRFHHVWLRDTAPTRVHEETGHRVEETSLIPLDLRPAQAHVVDGDLVATWPDGTVDRFRADWLAAHDYSAGQEWTEPARTLWRPEDRARLPRASYPEIVADETARCRFVTDFGEYGVGFLTDVGSRPGTVAEVGSLLGQVRTTSWGRIFDVRSVTNANSLAFTPLGLVAHTDEAYRDPTPTVQLQHFLTVDTSGGDATLVDGFALAEHLRAEHPAAFDLLVRTELRFDFVDAETRLTARGTTIDLAPDGRVRAIRYSNHSVRPFLLPFDDMPAFYAAYTLFGRLREDPAWQLRIPMGAGEMYLVDNTRVLHGRTALTSGGARHLQSCYIEKDELFSGAAAARRAAGPGAGRT